MNRSYVGFDPRGLEHSDVRWNESYHQVGGAVLHLTHDHWKLHSLQLTGRHLGGRICQSTGKKEIVLNYARQVTEDALFGN